MKTINVNSKFLITTTYAGRVSETPLLSISKHVSLNTAFKKMYYKEHKAPIFFQLIKSEGFLYILLTKVKLPNYYSLAPSSIYGFQGVAKKLIELLGDKGFTIRYTLEPTPTNNNKIKAFKLIKVAEDSVLVKNESQAFNI